MSYKQIGLILLAIGTLSVTAIAQQHSSSKMMGSKTESSSPALGSNDELVFICHKGMHYSRIEVIYSFKGYLDEPRPIDNKPLFETMLKYIDYTPEKYRKTWGKMFFRRALFVPKRLDTDAEVIRWVAASYGGIGYVHSAPQGVNDVEVCGLN